VNDTAVSAGFKHGVLQGEEHGNDGVVPVCIASFRETCLEKLCSSMISKDKEFL
jgi:hypothetical protein